MAMRDAGGGAEMPRAQSEGSGRQPREPDAGVSSATAGLPTRPEAEVQLLEAILGRENMMAALRRVEANKGAPGVDGLSVADLRAHLVGQWPRIREDLLAGTGRRRCVGWKSPNPAAASASSVSRRWWIG